MSAADLHNTDELSQIAFARGLHLPPTRAEAFAEALLSDERARKRLEDSGYAALQQRIRTRAPARPDAVPPPLGRRLGALGTAALPGPQPGIETAGRRPAVLPPLEQNDDYCDEFDLDVNSTAESLDPQEVRQQRDSQRRAQSYDDRGKRDPKKREQELAEKRERERKRKATLKAEKRQAQRCM